MPSPSPTVAARALSLYSFAVNGGQGAHRRNPCGSSRWQSPARSCDDCGHACGRIRAQHLFVQQGEGPRDSGYHTTRVEQLPRKQKALLKVRTRTCHALSSTRTRVTIYPVWLGYYQRQSCAWSSTFTQIRVQDFHHQGRGMRDSLGYVG